MGGDDLERSGFVDAQWLELRRLAVLIAGGSAADQPTAACEIRTTAVRILTAVLTDWRAVRESGRPSAHVRSEFLRRLLTLPPDANPEPLSASGRPAPLADAWWSLSALQRAAYVLVERDQLSAEDAADLLGMPSADVRGHLTCATAGLEQAHGAARVAEGREPTPWAMPSDLGRTLDEVLWAAPDWGDPWPLITEQLDARRSRRRLIGGGALLVAAAVALAWFPGTKTRSPVTASPRPTLPSASVAALGPGQWPSRGRLALDPTTTAAVAERFGSQARTLWADDVDNRRYVLVIPRSLRPDEPGDGHLLSGAAGTAVADLDDVPVWMTPESSSVLTLITAPEGASDRHLVVLGAPGTTGVEWSQTVTIADDLTVGRQWQDLPLIDGVAVRTLPPLLPALSVQRLDHGPAMNATLQASSADRPAVPCADCGGPPEINGRLGAARASVAAATDLPPGQIAVEVVYAGTLDSRVATTFGPPADPSIPDPPTPDPVDSSAVDPAPGAGPFAYVARLHLPSGAVLQTSEILVREGLDYDGDGTPEVPGPTWQTLALEEPIEAGRLGAPIVMPWSVGGPDHQGFAIIVPPGSGITTLTSLVPDRINSPSPAADPPRVAVTGPAAYLVVPYGSQGPGEVSIVGLDAAGEVVATTPLFNGKPIWWGPYDAWRAQAEAAGF